MIYLLTKSRQLWENFELCTFEDVVNYINSQEYVNLDLETEGFDPYTKQVLTLQVGDSEVQYVIDTQSYPLKMFTCLNDKIIVGHNLSFDLRFLYHADIVPKGVWDTYICELVQYRGILQQKGFYRYDNVVERYTGKTDVDKSIRGQIHYLGLTSNVIEYAAKDVEYLSQIREGQVEKLQEKDLLDYAKLENAFVRPIAYVQYCGFKIDVEKWQEKIDRDKKILSEKKEIIDNWLIENGPEEFLDRQQDLFSDKPVTARINWGSDKQVKSLFKKLGIKVEIEKKGKIKESIQIKFIQEYSHPLIKPYIEYSQAKKQVESFGENILKQLNPVTKRLHTVFSQIKDTGRISSGGTDKLTGLQGLNLQQIPGEDFTRSCFVARIGNMLSVNDYSSQESVVLANISQEPKMIEFFNSGLGDMHSFVASLMYNIPVEDIIHAKEKKDSGEPISELEKSYIKKRSLAKNAGFAINYGGTGYTIHQNTGISKEQGEEVYNSYFKAFPQLKQHFDKIKREAMNIPYVPVDTVFRSKTYLTGFETMKELEKQLTPEFWDNYRIDKTGKQVVSEYYRTKSQIERSHLNYMIQGTSGIISKLAGIYMFNHVMKEGLFKTVLFCNFVHDEIVIEAPKEIIEQESKVLSECMAKAGDPYCKTVRLHADGMITKFWKK